VACILFLLGSSGHQVLDVGVSKMLVRRLIRIFSYVCKGSKPKYKSRVALARAAFRRLGFLRRRSQRAVPHQGTWMPASASYCVSLSA